MRQYLCTCVFVFLHTTCFTLQHKHTSSQRFQSFQRAGSRLPLPDGWAEGNHLWLMCSMKAFETGLEWMSFTFQDLQSISNNV